MRHFKRTRSARYAGRGARPSRQWLSIQGGWTFNAVSVTTTSSLISLQAPTTLALTSDPPEDITVLRIVGEYTVSLSNNVCTWALALLAQDTDWTPGTFNTDSDKRILWNQAYQNNAGAALSWTAGGYLSDGTTGIFGPSVEKHTFIDISPKVRLETGKALYLVAYEVVSGGTLSLTGITVRMLIQRTGGRR